MNFVYFLNLNIYLCLFFYFDIDAKVITKAIRRYIAEKKNIIKREKSMLVQKDSFEDFNNLD